jgi:pilus assembly protein FimV
MHYRRKLLPLYIAATLASGQAAAVGLGDLSLHSYLGKPFQAEVALSHMGDLSVDQLKVQIANEADYGALGVEYNYQHGRLRIEPFTKDGQTFIRITSSEPISEPYLNFVLTLRWPQGQVVREFTVLLDPAPAGEAVTDRVETQDRTSTEPLVATKPVAVNAVDANPIVEPSSAPVAPSYARLTARRHAESAAESAPQLAGGSYVTRRGDSLWRLAAKLRSSDAVPVEQMMAALQSVNPHAFIDSNASKLKEGVSIDVAAAERIALQGGASPARAVVAAETVAADTAAANTTTNTVAAARMNSAAAMPTGLVEENTALKAQVADLSANVSTLNTHLAESTDRLRQMEARLDNVLRQFEQQRAAQASAFDQRTSTAVATSGSVINQVNAAELRPMPQVLTPWWVHLLYWSGIAAAVGWAVREHFWPARRLAFAGAEVEGTRRVAEPAAQAFREVQRPVPATTGQAGWQVPAEDEVLTLDLGDIMPALDADPAPIVLDLPRDTERSAEEQVDASISAGVFVAFGRFDEAERLLQEALKKDSTRDDLRLQLLDVYLQSDQPQQFEQLAQDLESGPASVETLAELAVLRDSFQSRG